MKFIKVVFKNKFIVKGLVFSIVCLVLFQLTENREFLVVPFGFGVMFPFLLFAEYDFFKQEEKKKKIKNGTRKYPMFLLSKEKFVRECQTGLLPSVVNVKGNIYELEVQLDKVNSKNYNKFICYIDNIEIKGIDNFLNYQLDSKICLNDLEKIEFLEYNGKNPRKYFEDKEV